MDQEQLEQLLLENNKLLKENNKLIKKTYSYIKRTFYARILYWIIVVAIALGLYYYMQPYVEKVISAYDTAVQAVDSTKSFLENPFEFLNGEE